MSPRSLLLLAVLLLSAAVASAQSGESLVGDIMEQWADRYDSETVPDDVVERLQQYLDEPFNINDTASGQLEELPFVTELQAAIVKAYIAQYGELASMEELSLLNGFDSLTVALLRTVAIAAPVARHERLTLRKVLGEGHSNLRVGAKSVFPRSRAYEEEKYAGDPYRYYFRYLFKYKDKVELQLAGENDAGELFRFATPASLGAGVGQYGFDHYEYHLLLKDFGIVRRAVVGKYQLQFGQGVTLWSGYAPWMSGSMPLRRYGQGIRPASAFSEYGYMRGAAATLALRPRGVELTLFYSDEDRDATVRDTLADGEVRYQSLYQSGYHRTATENAKRGALREQLLGAHLEYGNGGMRLGATAVASHYASAIAPADYVYNTFAFSGKDNLCVGVDGTYRHGRLLLFGEGSLSVAGMAYSGRWLPVAAVGGAQLHLDANNLFSAACYYGSPTFQNAHSNIVGQGGATQNSAGTILFFRSRLPFYIDIESSADFFSFPWMRYGVYSPSTGCDMRVKISKNIVGNTVVSLQYREQQSQRNGDTTLYAVERTARRQLHLSLDYRPSRSWRLLSRVVLSWFDCELHTPEQGFLVFQEVSYRTADARRPLSLTLRMSLFDIEAYDARIYAYENDLMYEYSVPMFNGRGIRCYAVVRYDLTPRLALALKYAFSRYPESLSLGSGYDTTPGDTRHELKAQMRLKF